MDANKRETEGVETLERCLACEAVVSRAILRDTLKFYPRSMS
jgi:hypothetical protein